MTCALLLAGSFCAGFACRWACDHAATRRARTAALLVFIAACVAVIALYALGVVTVPYACTFWLAPAPFAGAVAAEFACKWGRRRALRAAGMRRNTVDSKTGQRISIAGWAGVALDALLLIMTASPGTAHLWGLSPLLPYRRAIDAVALALLLAGGLLEGVGRLGARFPRLSSPPVEEGELRWSQRHSGLRGADWFARALLVYGGALPVLFVAAAVLLFLFAPARSFLFFVALVAYFPTQRLGQWLALRWLARTRPCEVSLSPRGMAVATSAVPWEGLSCFEVGPAPDRLTIFGRPFPTPPLVALEPPPELAADVQAMLRARLREATADERAAWRRKQPAWIAQLSLPLLAGGAAVGTAFLLHERTLACAGLALAYILCERWYWALSAGILGLRPPRRPARAEVAPSPPPSRVLKAVSRLSWVALGLGFLGFTLADWWPAWRFSGYVEAVSFALLPTGIVLLAAEYYLTKRSKAEKGNLPTSPGGNDGE